ncbi:MAG: phage tail fiber protein [Thalassobaculaceae bacterium]|nr:phage tail fiber protein [Thalassobaculaceae bacterium]
MTVIDLFTGDGSTVSFPLSSTAAPSADALYVTIDGVSQLTDAYSVSGALLTFDGVPTSGAVIEARYAPDRNQNISTFFGNGVKQSFFLSKTPDSAAAVLVAMDGVVQGVETYDIQGNILLLPAPPPVDARVEVRFDVDAVAATAGFEGDGATTDFALPFTALAEDQVLVVIDGVFQHVDAFTVDDSILTFDAAPPLDAEIEVRQVEDRSSPLYGACFHTTVSFSPNGCGDGTTVQATA